MESLGDDAKLSMLDERVVWFILGKAFQFGWLPFPSTKKPDRMLKFDIFIRLRDYTILRKKP